MQLKPYQPDNLTAMLALFHRTVHTVNARDYTPQQQDAWAPDDVTQDPQRRARWDQTLREHLSLLAWEGEELMGFGDIRPCGGVSGPAVWSARTFGARGRHRPV